MAMNSVTLVGNLTADPTLRYTPKGDAVVNFRIAHTPRRRNGETGNWENGEAVFFACTDWRQRAENIANSLSKGDSVIVIGKLQSRKYTTREGEERTVTEIMVDEIGPSLEWATVQITKNPRGGGNGGSRGGNAPAAPANNDYAAPSGGSEYSDEPPF